MGEMADMEIERLFDSYEHDHGGLSSYGREFPTSIRCKRCGSGPFDWERFGPWSDPQWRLVDDDGNLHVCQPSPKTLGFGDIT